VNAEEFRHEAFHPADRTAFRPSAGHRGRVRRRRGRLQEREIPVTNDHFEGREIEIRKIKFTNPHNNGKEQTEDVKTRSARTARPATDGDNLSNADKVDLHSSRSSSPQEHDDQWSKEFVTQPFADVPEVHREQKYGPIVVKDSD
jgi:hypothetical protein